MEKFGKIHDKVAAKVDAFNMSIQRMSIARWHIFLLFVGFGLYLVILPILHIIVVSTGMELYLGNYTNIISAGVSLLTLAAAVRIAANQDIHRKHIENKLNEHDASMDLLHDKIDRIHEHMQIDDCEDCTPDPLPPFTNPNLTLNKIEQAEDDFDTMRSEDRFIDV